MSHGTDHTRSNGAEDGNLDSIVRDAVASQTAETLWPDTEAILAYLHNEGSDEQRRDVREAIAESAEFRRFLVDTGHQIEELRAPELISQFPPPRPIRKTILERIGTRLTNLVRIPSFVPALAAVSILFMGLAIDPMGWFDPKLQLYDQLDPLEFATFTQRNGNLESAQPTIMKTAYKAALNQLRWCVEFDIDSGTFILHENPLDQASDPSAQGITLSLLDDADRPMSVMSSYLPHDVRMSGEDVQVWIFFLPSKQLWRSEVPEPSIDVQWTPDMGDRGCVTFTYPTESGFQATRGVTFTIP